jgi:hypothetical protein
MCRATSTHDEKGHWLMTRASRASSTGVNNFRVDFRTGAMTEDPRATFVMMENGFGAIVDGSSVWFER